MSSRKKAQNKPDTANLNEMLEQQPPSAEPSTSSDSNSTRKAAVSSSQVSSLQEYKVRPGISVQGIDYEHKIAALLSLRSSFLGVEDFWLATNAQGAGHFDDIILHIKKPNSDGITFMFQLKHKSIPKNILEKEFLSLNRDFSLPKYFKDIEVLHESIHSGKEKTEIVDKLGPFHNIYFIIYTNRKTNDYDFLENCSNTNLHFLNTTKNTSNIYKINVGKILERIYFSEAVARANLFLLSDQSNVEQLDYVIEKEFKRNSKTLGYPVVNNELVVKNFIKHIVAWYKEDLDGRHYLTKQDILLFLHQYNLNFKDELFHNCENKHEFVLQEIQQKNLNEKLQQQPLSAEPSTSSDSNTTQQAAASGSQVSSLMKYKVRPGVSVQGIDYERKIAALLSLRCKFLGVEDFWLATNAEGVGAFDDIILHVKKPNSGGITFMFQLKHRHNPKNILQSEFLSPKGDFSLSKHFKDIEVLHESINSYKNKSEIVDKLGPFDNIHFVIYTNRGTNHCNFLENYSDTNLNFLSTGTQKHPYKVNVNKLPENIDFSEVIARANLYLLSNQSHAKNLDYVIKEEFKKISSRLGYPEINNEVVAKGFIEHIVAWNKGELGGHYYLTN